MNFIRKTVKTTSCIGQRPSEGEVRIMMETQDGSYTLITYVLPLNEAIGLREQLTRAIAEVQGIN